MVSAFALCVTGTLMTTITRPHNVLSVAMSADGSIVAGSSLNDTVAIWEVDAGAL